METAQIQPMTKKDYYLSLLAGFLIGLLLLPVLKAAKPDLYEKFFIAIIPFFLIGTPLGIAIAHRIGKKISTIWQIAKFGVIGVLNTLVDLGILSVLIFLFRSLFGTKAGDIIFPLMGITFYSIYKSASFIAANINSYYWNKYWTFDQTIKEKNRSEFLQFFAVSIVGFLVNVTVASVVFKSVTPFAGFNSDQWGLIGAAAGSILGLVWNFIGYKFIVFKK
ncbi:MAG TPA: GtrA family protein [Patescibacteria group bacterium]